MFRRLPASLPRDPQIPHTLEELDYFINGENQVRSKSNPEELFAYRVSKSSRYNEMRRTVIRNIIREEVSKRMTSLDIQLLYLPQMVLEQPVNQQHLPIYITLLNELNEKSRLIVVIPGQNTELGMWSTQDILGESGIEAGSAISLVRILKDLGRNAPGMIVLNPNETYFSHELSRPLTLQGWQDRPRMSALHPMPVVDNTWNRIPGNESAERHIQSVLENLVNCEKYVRPDCKIDIVGLMNGGNMVMEYLDRNWAMWANRISTISLISTWQSYSYITSNVFAQFLKERGRAWDISQAPPNTPIACPLQAKSLEDWERHVVCPTFSGGVPDYGELIFPRMQRTILDWMNEVAEDANYTNPKFVIKEIAFTEDVEEDIASDAEENSGPGEDGVAAGFNCKED